MAPERSESDRIEKLEEASAYADRTVEQLSAEVFELNKKLEKANARIARLESRLQNVADDVREAMTGDDGDDDDPLKEAPPHASGGPRHPSEPQPRP